MSLVNLSHVCSHLQNASLARLGLTSIPYTRLHLSLSLLLQKQGFLSQVKLGGPSPPASCFPPGIRDNARITGHPHQHGEGSLLSPESALQRMVTGNMSEEGLRQAGFGDEAIAFAVEQREKSKAQLDREGWHEIATDFFLRHEDKSREQLEAQGFDEGAIEILEQHAPFLAEARAEVMKWHGDRESYEAAEALAEEQGLRSRIPYETHIHAKMRDQVLRTGFDAETLRFFAGTQRSLRTERDLQRDGVTLNAMGVDIENQPYNPPPLYPSATDPWGLEAEGVVTQANRASRRLWLGMKYWDGLPVLRKARMLSKPTKRIWLSSNELGQLTRGREAAKGQVKPLTQVGEVVVVSTDLGVLEVRECVERRVGGMVLCRIW